MTVGKRRLAKASALSPAEMHEVVDKVSAGETRWLVSGALSLRPSGLCFDALSRTASHCCLSTSKNMAFP